LMDEIIRPVLLFGADGYRPIDLKRA